MRTLITLLGCTIALCASPVRAASPTQEPLLVFAAASLTDSLQKVSDAYTARTGAAVKLSFAASSALARQIEAGAGADVFFPADQEWMDYLEERRLIDKASRTDVLGNRLALVAPRDSVIQLKLGPNAPVAAALGASGRLATGDPDSVPAGKYAKAALTTLKLWPALESRLARAENVRVALSYVARGEAPLGIVYATDAQVEPRVRIVDLFPESSHAPITYPVARTAAAKPAAARYIDFLRSPEARAVFVEAGFRVLSEPVTSR
jgi:molybdate transport system substrate-binding protein